MLQINLEKAIEQLKKNNFKKILVQIPEGLKTRTDEIALELEKNDFEIITIMDPCFGACDIKIEEAKKLNCDALLHIGHSEFIKTDFPVVYAPLEYKLKNLETFLKKILDYLNENQIKKIGFVTTIQYINYLGEIKDYFNKNSIGVNSKSGEKTIESQVLGCNYSSVPIEENILYFGDGLFHPLGIHFATKKEVIIANPLTLEIKKLDKEKNDFLRKRILLIERAKDVSSYGILVSTKVGQNKIIFARKIKKMLEEKGKSVKIFAMDYISEDKLLGTNVGAYINTACPRLSIDDYSNYKKPMINAFEVKYLLGENYDNYALDMIY
ncbi:MAG: diphthamide biosynthesis enzyme Dph2 [Candidatus ainarchaeum sp.]|nr:diphthamide biosynthesis enzyme Dph2 [Candidatus ainarchaeum sp.]